MSHSLLYPGFIKLAYTSALVQHYAILPCLPTFDGGTLSWGLDLADGSNEPDWTAAVDDYVTVFKALLPSGSAVIQSAELWVLATPEDDPVFKDAHSIAVAGTAAGSPLAAQQITLTNRTIDGGISKQVAVGTTIAPNGKFLPPTFSSNAAITAWSNFILSASNFIVGRDGSFPIAAIKALSKTNDAIRRKTGLV